MFPGWAGGRHGCWKTCDQMSSSWMASQRSTFRGYCLSPMLRSSRTNGMPCESSVFASACPVSINSTAKRLNDSFNRFAVELILTGQALANTLDSQGIPFVLEDRNIGERQ